MIGLILLAAPHAGDETLVLSPVQGCPYVSNLLWSALHSTRELAADDWNYSGGVNLQ